VKVLQLIQRPQLRGAEIFACQLSLELSSLGIRCDVACLFDTDMGLRERFPQIDIKHLGAVRERRLLDLTCLRRLHKLVQDGGYHLVQANAGDTLKYAALSKALFGWKARLVFRNANKLSDFIRGPLHAALNKWMLRRCDHVVSVSEYCRQDVIRFQPALVKRSTTITIGTYVGLPSPALSPRDIPVFINIASFVPEKNHEFLIRVFAAFVKKNTKGLLKLVGDGRLRDRLQKQCELLGIREHVEFLGYQRDPWSQLSDVSALVMPSKIEGLPAVILEAMALHVPVVASAVGGIPEVVRNSETGYSIVGYNVDEYVSAMEMACEEATRLKITGNAYDEILRNYQMSLVAGNFKHVYEAIGNASH